MAFEVAEDVHDSYRRRIDYLRLSITDRCNLRCVYCLPPEGVAFLPHEEILRYEEILRLATIALNLGLSKIRLTGGEPLVRRDVVYLCRQLTRLPGLQSLSLTTNGVLLAPLAEDLYRAGITRLNISLDTLDPDRYARITNRDHFHRVWEGITAAQEVGFAPIKINVVPLAGVNDDEIEALASLTYRHPLHVRFIELMPTAFGKDVGLTSGEVLARLTRLDTLVPTHSVQSNGPACYYRFPGGVGKIGLISPLSQHFCSSCNRLRLTADGRLFTCLFAQEALDLKALLRQGASDTALGEAIRQAVRRKPREAPLQHTISRKCLPRHMAAIGG
ncbi:MAG: GTP 3',8-cyclase MoaA [Desulfobacca sp.]|uniref:GTP 3',8-cyclase MoaA n=1 Tax=Desulfobacca sp. TaxID=2067990 RepID=UPI004049DAE7